MKENRLVTYSIVFIALVLLAIVLKTFQSVMRPLAIAALLLFLFTPLAQFSRDRKIPVWLTFGGFFVIVFLILSFVGSFISVDNVNLKDALPRFQERISQNSSGLIELGAKLGYDLEDVTTDKAGKMAVTGLTMGLGAIRTLFSEILLAMILMMFLIQSRSGLFSWVEQRYGTDEVTRLQETFQKIQGDILAYVGTKTLMSLGTAIVIGIVLLLFKAKFIYVSLLIIFLLNYIPIIGSLIAVLIVLLLYVLTIGLSVKVLYLFVLLMAVQVLFGSILEPKIAGSRLNMSPILIILSLYVWGWIWGVIGMLLSVPLTILIMIVSRHVGHMKSPPVLDPD